MSKYIIKKLYQVSAFLFLLLISYSCQSKEQPDKPSTPQGPASGQAGIAYDFTANAIDPSEDSISIQFDWGDGNLSHWSPYKKSGQNITLSYIWSRSGTYQIRAMAKNKREAFSELSSAHTVSISSSESWTKTFGGTNDERGYSIKQTVDGGYIIAGTYSQFDAYDVYLAKTDGLGNLQWSKVFTRAGWDEGHSVQLTTDGGYIIAGYASGNLYLLKTDGAGNLVWEKTFDTGYSECGYEVQPTTDGGYIMVGTIMRTWSNLAICLIKTDGNGILVWQKIIEGSNNKVKAFSVKPTTDGGYIIAGEALIAGYDDDIKLIKTDGQGSILWEKTFGSTDCDDFAWSIIQTNDGGYAVTGQMDDLMCLIKTDNAGNSIWQKKFNIGDEGNNGSVGWSVQQTRDGGYLIAGRSNEFECLMLVKTDADGNLVSLLPIGGYSTNTENDDEHGAAIQTTDGGYAFVCWTSAFSDDEDDDVYLIKIGATGKMVK